MNHAKQKKSQNTPAKTGVEGLIKANFEVIEKISSERTLEARANYDESTNDSHETAGANGDWQQRLSEAQSRFTDAFQHASFFQPHQRWTEQDLLDVEATYNRQLPADFCEFVTKIGSGSFTPQDWRNTEMLGPAAIQDKQIQSWSITMQRTFLPFLRCPNGDMLALSIQPIQFKRAECSPIVWISAAAYFRPNKSAECPRIAISFTEWFEKLSLLRGNYYWLE